MRGMRKKHHTEHGFVKLYRENKPAVIAGGVAIGLLFFFLMAVIITVESL